MLAVGNETESVLTPSVPEVCAGSNTQADVARARGLRASVLLVDDKPANLVALEAVLEPLGHELVRAHSGNEALAKLAERDFAVALLDVRMPGMDGYEIAARMRQQPSTRLTPIIFITAADFDEHRVLLGYSHGAVDYLVKPFHPAMLASKVSVLVDLYLSRETIREQAAALRQAEREALERQSETQRQRIIDLMPLSVIALHADGKPYYCNRAWREDIGIELDSESGINLLEAVHPEDRLCVYDTIKESIAAGRSVEIECRLRSLRNGFRWHVVRALPDLGADGKIAGWIATAVDVERQKQAEQQATLANRMKDQFLAVVSHELRTPLTAIAGWASILQSGKLDATRLQRGLETIQRNAKSQALLIEDILDVARILSGKLRLKLGQVNVRAVVDAAVESARPAAAIKEIELEDVPEPVPLTWGDTDRLQQVVSNLLTNAVKFTERGGKVRVCLKTVGDEIEIRVEDNGCGIDAGFLPYVFDPFRQADSSEARRQGGLGLGLAIVDHIVRLHDGTVAAHSLGVGRGSTFIVTMPVREAPTSEDVERAASAVVPRAATRLRGLKVLVVDDEADTREYLVQVLRSAGTEVRSAASAKDAFYILAAWKPDVLLSDIGLAGEDGYSLIRKVRSLATEEGGMIPALALTAYTRPEDASLAREAGFDLVVPKPIEPFEVVDVVAQLAQLRQ
jgi:PAS domain S-box-containing protein